MLRALKALISATILLCGVNACFVHAQNGGDYGPHPVWEDGHWRLITHTGQCTSTARYKEVISAYNGVVAAKSEGGWWIVGPDGTREQLRRPDGYSFLYFLGGGFCAAKKAGVEAESVYLYRSLHILPREFDDVGLFACGRLPFRVGGKWGFTDGAGEVVVPAQYDYADRFHEGVAVVLKGDETAAIDRHNNVLFTLPSDRWIVERFHEGLAPCTDRDAKGSRGRLFLDTRGRPATERYDEIGRFSQGLAPVKKGNAWGFINSSGEFVIPCQYKQPGRFYNGVADVQTHAGEWQVISRLGTVLRSIGTFRNVRKFEDGVGLSHSEPLGLVDRRGRWIWKTDDEVAILRMRSLRCY